MKFSYRKNEYAISVYLHGRLDVHLTREIEVEFSRIIDYEKPSHLIVNLNGIEYMSSSGLTLFLTIMRSLKKKGKKLVMCNLNSSVKKIIEIVELSGMFETFRNENEALLFLAGHNSAN